jgi:pyruvate, water dikinase
MIDPSMREGTRPLLPVAVAVALATLTLAACGGDGGRAPVSDGGGEGGDAHGGADGGAMPTYLTHLATAEDFARLVGEGWAVKYLAAVPGRRPPAALDLPCLFQNTALYPFHLYFLRTIPGVADLDPDSYRALTLNHATRSLWAGELQLLPTAIHPTTGRPGVLALFVYSEPPDAMSVDDLAALHGRILQCAPYAGELLTLVGVGPEQSRDFVAKAPALGTRGVVVGDLERLRPVVGAEGYSTGEGVGYLRIVPRGRRADSYGPRDVLITEGTFEDLGLVAGLITSLPQNVHSHVNLRLREKQIPNARIPDVYDNRALAMLDGRLIRLTVSSNEARLQAASLTEAQEFWASHRPPPRVLTANLAETRLLDFTTLAATDAPAYGAKAANLGELYRLLPAANRAPGFGIPFHFHRELLRATGLQSAVEAVLTDPRLPIDASFRRTALAELRATMENASLPPALITQLQAPARAAFGEGYAALPLRFRSSSNLEDGELGSGAGLHDSARGCFADDADGDQLGPSACLSPAEQAALQAELSRRQDEWRDHPERSWLPAIIEDLASDLTRERSVARAIKKVYASLWNERAFEEREYYRIDHRTAFMGLAVNPSFVRERLDAVAVTSLPSISGTPLYRVVSQKDGQPVVRPPDPSLVAETLTFRRGADGRPTGTEILVPSSLSPQPLWAAARLDELGALLFSVQDHFARAVYPGTAQLSLDLEIKLTEDDRIVIKQARPYRNVGP